MPGFPKQGAAGYFAGSLGELTLPTNRFNIVNASNGAIVFQGTLQGRPDVGYLYSPRLTRRCTTPTSAVSTQ